MADDDGRDRRLSFSLPPITLPPLFPDRLRIRLPVPGFHGGRELSSGWALVVALGFDLADALLATTGSGPVHLVRSIGGAAVAVTLGSWLGLAYVWEVAAVLGGLAPLTMVPSLSMLLLGSLYLRGRR